MAFRRDKKKVRKWQIFLEQHQEELLACGIPFSVLEDEWNWEYFLDYGYYMPVGAGEPVVSVDHMQREQTERLCLFLEREIPNCSALNRLQFLLRRGRHAKT
jgi:hypothetical protein